MARLKKNQKTDLDLIFANVAIAFILVLCSAIFNGSLLEIIALIFLIAASYRIGWYRKKMGQ